MHAADLVEVAGIAAHYGSLVAGSSRGLSTSGIEQYWAASRQRAFQWGEALEAATAAQRVESSLDTELWTLFSGTVEEILTGELLARVWAAVLVAHDQRSGTSSGESIARNVLTTHLAARHRALALLIDGNICTTEEAVQINRLRRRCERWADVLIGGLYGAGDVRELAVDPRRSDDFATDLSPQGASLDGRQAWRLTLASLRGAFHNGRLAPSPNPDANARIAASVLSSFPPDLFDATGQFQSLWMMRLSAGATDAEGLIDDLLKPPRQTRQPASLRLSDRWAN